MTPDDKKLLEGIRSDVGDAMPDVLSGFEFLLAQLDEAHEALRFYANPDNWNYRHNSNGDEYSPAIQDDQGAVAKEALGESDE